MLEQEGIKTFSLNASTNWSYLKAILSLSTLLIDQNIDLLQTLLFHASVVGALTRTLRRNRIPIILTRHYSDEHHILHQNHPLKRKRTLFLESLINRLSDGIIACSYYAREVLVSKEGVPPGKITVIPYGLDFSCYAVSPKTTQALRNQLGLKGKIVLGIAARIVEINGYRCLFEALAKLAHPKVVLLVVGDGPQLQEFQELSHALGLKDRVHFLGFKENLPDILSVMDILVHPSITEGLPQVVMEGMLMGLLIVGSRIKPMEELIVDGVHGLLLPPNNASALARCLQRLVNSLKDRKAMGEAGRHYALKNFDMKKMVKAYENLYRKLLTDKRG